MRVTLERGTFNMRVDLPIGEENAMSEGPDDLEEVQRRVEEIQRRKRGRIQWKIGKHTAEIAIDAIEEKSRPSKNGKPRRRKKRKRLL